jgi:hypothetical protein
MVKQGLSTKIANRNDDIEKFTGTCPVNVSSDRSFELRKSPFSLNGKPLGSSQ